MYKRQGQPLAEVETDKVTTDIPSPKSGRIIELKYNEGDTIEVEKVFVVIDLSGDLPSPSKDNIEKKEVELEEETAGVVGEVIASSEVIPPSTEGQESSVHKKSGRKKVLATPVARKLAKDLSIDITTIKGTGPNGRVMKKDIKEAAQRRTNQPKVDIAPRVIPPVYKSEKNENIERIPLTNIRKTISKQMEISKFTICLLYTSTSGGEFHEALNFAGVFKAPTIFVIQNNQYAISVPRIEQTASKTLAHKAIAYGIPGIQVDGNDIFAMYVATKEAADRARRGEGPTLIEAITYRLAAHTTSDDPTKYREDAEVEEWKTRDPILRFKTYLENKGILTKEWDEKMKKEVENEITSTFEEIEGKADTKIEEIFMYHYETMSPILEEQLKEYKDFLEGGKNNDK